MWEWFGFERVMCVYIERCVARDGDGVTWS